MNELDERLARCFLAVFPDLDGEQVAAASAQTTPEWDSLHALMLIAVIEEAFELAVPASAYRELQSYEAARRYLDSRAARKDGPDMLTPHPGVAGPGRDE